MTPISNDSNPAVHSDDVPREPSMLVSATVLASRWRSILLSALAASGLALGITFVVSPTYTAATSFLPPQQQSGLASTALASLGSLAGLAAGAAGLKSPADQYVSLLQSVTVADRIIDRFKLAEVYDLKLRSQVRQELGSNVRVSLGKKDGLITVVVDDSEPARAADMANAYVAELRKLTSELAITEAQQRRAFFERQIKATQESLVKAQKALQDAGFTAGSINAEPKAAAETYAKLRAEKTAAEVKLQTLRSSLNDNALEVRSALAMVNALTTQLNQMSEQRPQDKATEGDYLSKYREYKYQEALYESFARQLELAKLDEAREGAMIQVVDAASPPDRRAKPKRVMTAALVFLISLFAAGGLVLARHRWKEQQKRPEQALLWQQFKLAFKR